MNRLVIEFSGGTDSMCRPVKYLNEAFTGYSIAGIGELMVLVG